MHVHVYFMYTCAIFYIFQSVMAFTKKQFFITQCLTDVFVRINQKNKAVRICQPKDFISSWLL